MKFILYFIIIILASAVAKFIFGRGKSTQPESANAKLSRQSLNLEKLKEFLLKKASEQCGEAVRNDPLALTRIHECAQKSLQELKTNGKSEINIPFLIADQRGPKHFNLSVDVDQI